MDNKEKIIIKSDYLPGVDQSVVDLTLFSTVKPRFTKVTKLMYKKRGLTFIGTKGKLDNHDVIQVGNLGLKYKVQKLEKVTDREGFIYKVRRICNSNTTALDIDSIKLGDKVHIVNRKTFDQMFNYACSLREEKCIEGTIDLCNTEACDNSNRPVRSQDTDVVEETCSQYKVVIPPGTGPGKIDYKDCNGDTVIDTYSKSKQEQEFLICILKDSVINSLGTSEYVGPC